MQFGVMMLFIYPRQSATTLLCLPLVLGEASVLGQQCLCLVILGYPAWFSFCVKASEHAQRLEVCFAALSDSVMLYLLWARGLEIQL